MLKFYVKTANVKRKLNENFLRKKRWIMHIKVSMVYVNLTFKIIDIINPIILEVCFSNTSI